MNTDIVNEPLTIEDVKRIKRLAGFHTMYQPRRESKTVCAIIMEGASAFNGNLQKALEQAGFTVVVSKNKSFAGVRASITKAKNVNHK